MFKHIFLYFTFCFLLLHKIIYSFTFFRSSELKITSDIQSAGEGAPQTQWNQMEVAAALGSRAIGIGYESLRMYHAILDVQAPPNAMIVEKIITDVLLVAEMVANQSMDNAKQAFPAGLC